MRTVLDPILFLSSPVHVTACDCDLVLRAASATPPAPPPRLDHVCAGVYATLEITSEKKAHKAVRALQLITEEADPSLLTDIEGQLTCPNACPGVFMVAHLRPQSCSIHKVAYFRRCPFCAPDLGLQACNTCRDHFPSTNTFPPAPKPSYDA